MILAEKSFFISLLLWEGSLNASFFDRFDLFFLDKVSIMQLAFFAGECFKKTLH